MAFYYRYEPVFTGAPLYAYAPSSDFNQLRRDVDTVFDSVLRPDNFLLYHDPLVETRGLWSRVNDLLDAYDTLERIAAAKRPQTAPDPTSQRRVAAPAPAEGGSPRGRTTQAAPASGAAAQEQAQTEPRAQPEARQEAAAAQPPAKPQQQIQAPKASRRGEAGPLSRLWHTAVLEPRVDVLENAGAYVVRAEVPGIPPEDIKLEVSGNVLTLSGELHRDESSTEGERVHRQERVFGRFSRQFRFPNLQLVSPQEIVAEFEHGVLTIKVPKPKSEMPVAIPVRIGANAAAEKAAVAATAVPAAPAAPAAEGAASQAA